MAAQRRHGQHGALYADQTVAGNGAASPVAVLNDQQIQFVTDKVEVTAFPDSNKVYVSGKPDASGTYKGFIDTASDQLYYAATGGQARTFYHYIDTVNEPNKYYYGTAIFDQTVHQAVNGAVEVSGSWAAAGAISRTWA